MTWDPRALRKSIHDVWLAGICGGLGEHTPLPAWLWRAIFIVTGIAGWGVVAYVVLWFLMPAGSIVGVDPTGVDGSGGGGTGESPRSP